MLSSAAWRDCRHDQLHARFRRYRAAHRDGVPVVETDAQAIPRMYTVAGLRDYFRCRDDVYVSVNPLIYYDTES